MRTLFLMLLLLPTLCHAGYFNIGLNLGASRSFVYNTTSYPENRAYANRLIVPNNYISVCPLDISFNTKHFNIGGTAGYYSKSLMAYLYVNHILFPQQKISPYYGIAFGNGSYRYSDTYLRGGLDFTTGNFLGLQAGANIELSDFADLNAELCYRQATTYSRAHITSKSLNEAEILYRNATYRYQSVQLMLGLRFCIGRAHQRNKKLHALSTE